MFLSTFCILFDHQMAVQHKANQNDTDFLLRQMSTDQMEVIQFHVIKRKKGSVIILQSNPPQ